MVKFSREADLLRKLAQQPRAEAVKCAQPDVLARGQQFQPAAHLIRSLVREGQRQNLVRRDAMREQISDAMRDDARLAAAWTGENQERSFEVLDRLALAAVSP